ncbi:MAG: hypothetical protein ACI87E_001931 [Mariniblastus sp.]|jgi:hypothetical protein
MAKRPDISVILVFNRKVVRADFSNRQLNQDHPAAQFFFSETVDVESTLCDAVTQATAGLAQPLAAKTIVMSSDVWTQLVSLPRLSVSDIDSDELNEALKFEAETLSGIDIDEISLANTPLGSKDDHQQFWVSAIRQSDLDDVHRLLESNGCREIAIAHPAGLSGNSRSAAGDSIEVWDELAFHLNTRGSRIARVKQATADAFPPATPILYGGNSADQLVASPLLTVLNNDDTLIQFTANVAVNYVQRLKDLAAPLIRFKKSSRTTPIRHLMSGVIALAVVGFCFWHWQFVQGNNEQLTQQIVLVKEPAAAKKKYADQLIAIFEQRIKVESDDSALGDDLKRVQFFLDNERNRIAKLLALLEELRTDDLVIKKIGGTEEGVLIEGLSINGESAQTLASRLREKTVPLGWAVNPANQSGQQKLTTGGPWDYDILLTDTGPFESAVPARKKQQPASKGKP